MDVREEIRTYLENPETLYKEWYLEQMEYETGVGLGEPVGTYEDWKKAFVNWVNIHKSKLRKAICPRTDEIKKAKKKIDMVFVIINLIEEQPYVGAVIKTASGLLLYGIDKLCKDYDS
jgi:hypothetical protein